MPLTLYDNARHRAGVKGTPFAVTVDDVRAVWPADDRCPVFGTPLRTTRGGPGPGSPTLDRLNNAWGYEPGNIVVISHRANKLKNDASAGELERLAEWMKSHGLS